MSDSTDLVVVGGYALPVAYSTEEVDDILTKVKASVRAEAKDLDISRPADRAEIKSLAYKVSRTKTALDQHGAELVADTKKRVGLIDAERRRVRDELDALRDEIRKPVTDWERAESERVAGHEGAIKLIEAHSTAAAGLTSVQIEILIGELNALPPRDWQEFAGRAEKAIAFAREDLEDRIARAKQREAEEAELARLKAEEAARQFREMQERIAAEAAEKAKREAEEKARLEAERVEAERVAAERAARAKLDEAERQRKQAEIDRIAAENRARVAEEERVEAERMAEERRQRDAQAAEQRRVDAEASAIEAERRRVAKIAADEAFARHKREADNKHRGQINAAARDAIAAKISEAWPGSKNFVLNKQDCSVIATAIVKAIASGAIPNVKIEY
jgi:colicin import membrane protein